MHDRQHAISNDTLLEVATRHFAEKGFAGARMEEIAKEAGVNKATIYYRIGDKETLYHIVLIQHLDMTLHSIQQAVARAGDVEDKLRAHITALARQIDQQPCIAALLMREIAGGAEHITEAVLERMHQIRSSVLHILQEGQRSGRFKDANYFLIHLQIVGTLMFYAAGAPVRERMADISKDHSCKSPLSLAAEALADSIIHSVRLNHEDLS